MENTEAKKEKKITLKMLLAVIIPLLAIAVGIILFLCLRPADLYTVTEARYEAYGMDTPQVLKYNYDETGRLTSVTIDGTERYVYTYSDDYKTVTVENKNEDTERTIKFNDDFDVIEKLYSDGTSESFTYKKGKLVSSKNQDGITAQYEYKGKKLIGTAYSNGDTVDYEYSWSRILSETVTTASGERYYTFYHYNDDKTVAIKDTVYDAVRYEYDNRKRVISQTNNAGVSMSFTYDENDNITSIIYPTPAVMSYSYERVNISSDVYKQNKTLITYNNALTDETVELLK